jgi:O-6-methylguanine DNA methyltransferase
MKPKPAPADPLVELAVVTPDGIFRARYSATGLAALRFPSRRSGQLELNIAPAPIARWHRATRAALKRALAGRAPRVLPPLDLGAGTAFQQTVWQQLLKIPRGETRSYGELAKLLKNPRAARAVGSACGANPIPVLVPCHRVLAARHKIGGYSGGLDWKKKLLWREESRDLWQG